MDEIRELKQKIKELEALAERNSLTGLLNKRGLNMGWTKLQRQLMRTHNERDLKDISIIIFFGDTVGLKRINSEFGQHVGDRVLKTIAEVIAQTIRPEDLAGNPRGDEFVIVAPGNESIARAVEGRILAAVAKTAIDNGSGGVIVPKIRLAHLVVSAQDEFAEMLEKIDKDFLEKARGKKPPILEWLKNKF